MRKFDNPFFVVFEPDEFPVPTSGPLVTVLTSTWQRHDLLINRCIPSIKGQTYTDLEHIIVSDGQDARLGEKLSKANVTFCQLGRNWHSFHGGYGSYARLVGTYLARGKYIAYLDDDDEYYPWHIASLVYALENSDASFAFSKMERFDGKEAVKVFGSFARASISEIGTPMIMHKAELLKVSNWAPGPNGYAEDGHLIERWMEDKSTKVAFVDSLSVRNHWQFADNPTTERTIYAN